MTTPLDRWRAFIETQPEKVAEMLDLVDHAQSSPYTCTFDQLLREARGLLAVQGTPNEERWKNGLVMWALQAAECEWTKDNLIETLLRENIREEQS